MGISVVELEAAGCKWFCSGRTGCHWACGGGRRLNMHDGAPGAARIPLSANATELNMVDLPSVELEAAGCKWFCTGQTGCYWACGGGRRLNTSDAVADAARIPPDANSTKMNMVDISSIELQAAGCKWLCIGGNGCYWACGGGRRLNTSN